MPLDSSAYGLGGYRPDGRRKNDLRRLHAQISTQAAADGSSYLELGNTMVICTVNGPAEGRRGAASGGGSDARIEASISIAGFSGIDRKKASRNNRRAFELQHTLETAFSSVLLTHLYPNSQITINMNVLSQDGALLAACINAATLALIDAGIPASDYLVACTAGCSVGISRGPTHQPRGSSNASLADDVDDTLIDLSGQEEQELPHLTIATLGATDKVTVCMLENRMNANRLEEVVNVAIAGCKRIRTMLDGVIRAQGEKMLEAG